MSQEIIINVYFQKFFLKFTKVVLNFLKHKISKFV